MYPVWIPIFGKAYSKAELDKIVQQLKIADADMALLTFGRVLRSEAMLKTECENFKTARDHLVKNGFQVGAWLAPTIGYGGKFWGDNDAGNAFTHIRHLRTGEDCPGAFCPCDEAFVADFLNTLTAIVKMGVKTIMFEDDFTLMGGKFWRDLGCACEDHIADFCRRAGETLTREEIAERVFTGGKNRYRDIWREMQRDTLVGFVQKIEQAVHAIDPEVRIGLSANASSYDVEGVSVAELARIIAGDTRPFVRMTGAPYWKQALTLAPSIEAIRVQTGWCGDGIDLMTEGDTYPRPRHWVSSAFLEHYDMILRADGNTDLTLKYMIDYNSNAEYETGYVARHRKNKPHYDEIERRFSGKTTVGVHLFEKDTTFADRVLDEDCPIERFPAIGYLPFASQVLLTDNCIPITYTDTGYPTVAMGENARYVTDEQMKNGIITDAIGAKRLMERGIDIGVSEIRRAVAPRAEYYHAPQDYTLAIVPKTAAFYEMTVKEGAILDSEFVIAEGTGLAGVTPSIALANNPKYPACVRYENADGQKFMIYGFMIDTLVSDNPWVPGIFRNYYRQQQLVEGIKWLGKSLPAVCRKNPELYTLCRKDENSMAVGLWNNFPDGVLEPVIELDGEYRSVDFYHCNGRLDGNRVILDDELRAYDFAFFTVYK